VAVVQEMKANRLAIILMLLVAGTHYAYAPLALLYEHPKVAAKALFYVARGIEGAAVFSLLGLLSKRPEVWAVCALGFIEESETAVCRLSDPIDSVPGVEIFDGLCGQQYYALGLWALVCLALYMRGRYERITRP